MEKCIQICILFEIESEITQKIYALVFYKGIKFDQEASDRFHSLFVYSRFIINTAFLCCAHIFGHNLNVNIKVTFFRIITLYPLLFPLLLSGVSVTGCLVVQIAYIMFRFYVSPIWFVYGVIQAFLGSQPVFIFKLVNISSKFKLRKHLIQILTFFSLTAPIGSGNLEYMFKNIRGIIRKLLSIVIFYISYSI